MCACRGPFFDQKEKGRANRLWGREMVLKTQGPKNRTSKDYHSLDPTKKNGRASCRERGVDLGGRRIIKKKTSRSVSVMI